MKTDYETTKMLKDKPTYGLYNPVGALVQRGSKDFLKGIQLWYRTIHKVKMTIKRLAS